MLSQGVLPCLPTQGVLCDFDVQWRIREEKKRRWHLSRGPAELLLGPDGRTHCPTGH